MKSLACVYRCSRTEYAANSTAWAVEPESRASRSTCSITDTERCAVQRAAFQSVGTTAPLGPGSSSGSAGFDSSSRQ
ncbi:Uncharacterised protein [Mycobacteroides abscessus subsp. abscessus]|nr:Uncharacterised protein [Mycobacteroides abscessus subsp. abscessus]